MLHYLLEKSRVVTRNDNEQNFHIFYQMYAGLAADDRLDEFFLTSPGTHLYLQGVGAPADSDVLSEIGPKRIQTHTRTHTNSYIHAYEYTHEPK